MILPVLLPIKFGTEKCKPSAVNSRRMAGVTGRFLQCPSQPVVLSSLVPRFPGLVDRQPKTRPPSSSAASTFRFSRSNHTRPDASPVLTFAEENLGSHVPTHATAKGVLFAAVPAGKGVSDAVTLSSVLPDLVTVDDHLHVQPQHPASTSQNCFPPESNMPLATISETDDLIHQGGNATDAEIEVGKEHVQYGPLACPSSSTSVFVSSDDRQRPS